MQNNTVLIKTVIGLAILLGTVATWYAKVQNFDQKYDDAWIGYRIAKNIAVGNGAVFNKGERVRANTSLLYPVLISPAFFADDATAVHIVDLFDVATYIISVIIFSALLAGLIKNHLNLEHWAVFPVIFLFTTSLQVVVLGMETQLYIIYITLTLYLYSVKRQYFAAFIISCLGIYIRPDAVLLTAVIFVYCIFVNRQSLVKYLLSGGAIAMVYFLISYMYYGELIPHTAAVKDLLFPDKLKYLPGLLYGLFYPHNLTTFYSVFFIFGFIVFARRPDPFFIWGILYFLFFTFKATWFVGFGWYRVPFGYFVNALEAAGIAWVFLLVKNRLLKTSGPLIHTAFSSGAVILLCLYSYKIYDFNFIMAKDYNPRYKSTLRVTKQVANTLIALNNNQYVLIEPLGFVGFFAFNQRFKDFPGLASKEVFEVVKSYEGKGHFFVYGKNVNEFSDIVARVPGINYAVLRENEAKQLLKGKVITRDQIVLDCHEDTTNKATERLIIVKTH